MKTIICHMTHIDNLQNISQIGLLCKNLLKSKDTITSYRSIANKNVQDKRANVVVPKGTLHDYVPFYFYGATPMLYVNRHVQNDIIFLVSYTDLIVKENLPFIFTDRHAI